MEYIVMTVVADNDVVFMGRNGHFCRGRSERTKTLENLKWIFKFRVANINGL